ncbi:MAG TPA: CdaR family protein [Thermomicrobiaceae bacterium]|nr:CdaR family protein [Thermomicrobiaceae bacterium]
MRPRLRLTWTRFRNFFDQGNLVRFLVSLILAFALWAWVTAQTDPEITRTIPAVPVQEVNLGGSLTIVGPLPTVQLLLAGPRSRIQPLESGTVQVTVDLSDVKQPGTYTRPVHVSVPSEIRVSNVTPTTITVQIERISSQGRGPGSGRAPDVATGTDPPPGSVAVPAASTPRWT